MSAAELGRRAALELAVSDVRRDLQALIAEKNALLARADVCSALACEPGRSTVRNNTAAASYRLQAFTLGGEIATLRLRERNLLSQLESSPAAPAFVTAAQAADMDDTHNFVGAAA